MSGGGLPVRRWVEVGHFARFGGVLFIDETVPAGQDWAWLALRPKPLAGVPVVYFDQDSETAFPPRCIMPVDELSVLVLEWLRTGERPGAGHWIPVNDFRWKLDGAGDVVGLDD